MMPSTSLANKARIVYTSGKGFVYDHVSPDKMVPIKRRITVNVQRRSMKGLLLLFVEAYAPGARDSEKYVFPDLKKVSITINGSPNMIYNKGIEREDMWSEVSRCFIKEKHKPQHMKVKKFYADDMFRLLIDLRSMTSQEIHGSSACFVNSTDSIQLEIERDAKGSGTVNCHIYVISNAQFNIVDKQLESVQYRIYGSCQCPLQRTHCGADQLGEDAVSHGPAIWPFLWQV